MFVLPLQDAPEKFLPAEIVPRFLLRFSKVFFDGRLGPHPGMIGSRQPKHFETLHARPARQNVLNRVVEDVAQGQDARDVRRRNHDRKRRLGRMRVRAKIAGFEPAGVPLSLDCRGLVGFREFRHREGMMRVPEGIAK